MALHVQWDHLMAGTLFSPYQRQGQNNLMLIIKLTLEVVIKNLNYLGEEKPYPGRQLALEQTNYQTPQL